jgi:hypothetical protein
MTEIEAIWCIPLERTPVLTTLADAYLLPVLTTVSCSCCRRNSSVSVSCSLRPVACSRRCCRHSVSVACSHRCRGVSVACSRRCRHCEVCCSFSPSSAPLCVYFMFLPPLPCGCCLFSPRRPPQCVYFMFSLRPPQHCGCCLFSPPPPPCVYCLFSQAIHEQNGVTRCGCGTPAAPSLPILAHTYDPILPHDVRPNLLCSVWGTCIPYRP